MQKLSRAPLSATPNDFALKTIEEDSESTQLLETKERVNSYPLSLSRTLCEIQSLLSFPISSPSPSRMFQ